MRRTKENAVLTRETILDTALGVFSRKGYAAATLDDIAKEAGMSRGAIYWHFNNKAELYKTLVRERTENANLRLRQITLSAASPLEKIKALFIAGIELLETDASYRAIQNLILFKTEVTPDLANAVREKIIDQDRMLDDLSQLIGECQRDGSVKAELDPRTCSLFLLGLYQGLVSLYLLEPSRFGLSRFVDTTMAIIMNGLSANVYGKEKADA